MDYLRIALITTLITLSAGHAFAQSGGVNYQQNYLNAKTFFKEGKYSLAQEAFKPVLVKSPANPYAPYASFYFALSAYHQGYMAVARDMLLQLINKYPRWNNIDEANLWLGIVYFELGEDIRAFWALQSIKSKKYTKQVAQTKLAYLEKKPTDMVALKALYEEYPNDESLGRFIAQAIVQLPNHLQDRDWLEDIVDRFELDKEIFQVAEIPESVKKDKYTVAVLLPFMTEKISTNRSRKGNQFVLDLYEGIRMGIKTLEEEGKNIEVLVFDTKKSQDETTKILFGNPQLKRADLIIGPLFPGPSQVALDFSKKNKVNIVNPLSSNSDIISNHPFSFLYMPTHEAIGKKAGDYALENFENDKPGMIFYGESKGDSIRAHQYKKTVEEGGYNIVLTKQIDNADTQEILKLLTTKYQLNGQNQEEYVIASDSIGSIYVASDAGGLASNASSAIEIRGDSIKLLGSAKWLDYGFVNYDTYETMGVALVAPDYKNTLGDNYKTVRGQYIAKYATVPSENVLKGYELTLFFGNAMHQYGNYFQSSLQDIEYINGYIGSGFSYGQAHDNQVIPVLKFEEGRLVVTNDFTDKN